MTTREEMEKLYLYCIGEVKLLIETPCEQDSLLERLSAIKNNLELLYELTALKGS